MPDTTLTEEQGRQLVKRWRRYQIFHLMPFAIASLIVTFAPFFHSSLQINVPFYYSFLQININWMIIGYALIIASAIAYYNFMVKKFAEQINSDEQMVLNTVRFDNLNMDEQSAILRFTKECHKINPKKELLRPSQPAQDETLLRAATYTDTPQDQLLRPSQTEEESPPLTPFPE